MVPVVGAHDGLLLAIHFLGEGLLLFLSAKLSTKNHSLAFFLALLPPSPTCATAPSEWSIIKPAKLQAIPSFLVLLERDCSGFHKHSSTALALCLPTAPRWCWAGGLEAKASNSS